MALKNTQTITDIGVGGTIITTTDVGVDTAITGWTVGTGTGTVTGVDTADGTFSTSYPSPDIKDFQEEDFQPLKCADCKEIVFYSKLKFDVLCTECQMIRKLKE